MKKVLILMLMTAAELIGSRAADPDIVVYFHWVSEKVSVIGLAENEATRILRNAGISVEWRAGRADYSGRAEVIDAVLTAPDDEYRPGALASTRLGLDSGTRIEVFYNRIRAARGDSGAMLVLAYALAHEITHVIEGVNRHSDSGIMKARWNNYDFQRIRSNSLHFADEDLQMIHAWHELRNRTLLAER
jgi:hypothetical protein